MCFNLPLPVGPLFLINVIPVTCVLFTLRTASELVGALAEFIAMARVFNLPLPVGPLFLINVIPVTLCPFHLTNSLRAGWCPGRVYSNGTGVQLASSCRSSVFDKCNPSNPLSFSPYKQPQSWLVPWQIL